jgi:probable addiction module antidote protein
VEGVIMEEKFSRHDSAEYLKSKEDIALYIEAVMEEAGDDPALIAHALDVVARAHNLNRLVSCEVRPGT